jgi:hypothetical protein
MLDTPPTSGYLLVCAVRWLHVDAHSLTSFSIAAWKKCVPSFAYVRATQCSR